MPASGAALAADARTITVTGEGTATARPDMAVLTAGVATQGATAAEALAANSEATKGVIERFKAESVDLKDVQTSGFSLQPVYLYPKAEDASPAPPRITGDTVSNTVSVRIRDLDRLGAILDKVVSAGANSVNGIEISSLVNPSCWIVPGRSGCRCQAQGGALCKRGWRASRSDHHYCRAAGCDAAEAHASHECRGPRGRRAG